MFDQGQARSGPPTCGRPAASVRHCSPSHFSAPVCGAIGAVPLMNRMNLLSDAQRIIDRAKAAGRPMTPTERDDVRAKMDAVRRIDTKTEHDEDADLRRRLGRALRDDPELGQLGRFSAKAAAPALTSKISAKALAPSGAEVAPAGLSELAPLSLAKPATSLLAAVGATVLPNPPTYAYLRQTTRTNNAAAVADGATKPTSVYGLTRVEDRLRVIASLSEPVPKYWLDDSQDLRTFVESELTYGLDVAVEQQLLNGDGTGENNKGLLNTSGILSQAWSTDGLETLRKAITSAQIAGAQQYVAVLNPVDFEALTLVRATTNEFLATAANVSGDSSGATSPPYGPVALQSWGVPVVLTTAIAAGRGVVMDPSAVTLYTDGQINLEWNTSDGFDTNEVKARCETRVGVAVKRPSLVVSVDMSAAA